MADSLPAGTLLAWGTRGVPASPQKPLVASIFCRRSPPSGSKGGRGTTRVPHARGRTLEARMRTTREAVCGASFLLLAFSDAGAEAVAPLFFVVPRNIIGSRALGRGTRSSVRLPVHQRTHVRPSASLSLHQTIHPSPWDARFVFFFCERRKSSSPWSPDDFFFSFSGSQFRPRMLALPSSVCPLVRCDDGSGTTRETQGSGGRERARNDAGRTRVVRHR